MLLECTVLLLFVSNALGQALQTVLSSPTLAINGIPYSTRAYWMRRANTALSDLVSPCPFGAFGTVIVNHTDTSGKGDLVCIGANSNAQTGNPTNHGSATFTGVWSKTDMLQRNGCHCQLHQSTDRPQWLQSFQGCCSEGFRQLESLHECGELPHGKLNAANKRLSLTTFSVLLLSGGQALGSTSTAPASIPLLSKVGARFAFLRWRSSVNRSTFLLNHD